MKKGSQKEKVEEVIDLWKSYSNKREIWAQHAQEDKEFRLGKQWSADQKRILEERGQAPIVVNRIHPAVETAKALLTSNKPSFRVSPREDSDNQIAQTVNGLLEYIWQISGGDNVLRNVIDDYYTMGMGCMLVHLDSMADMGKGEVKVTDIDPLDVYIDPNARSRTCDDAEGIIISRLFTKDQAISLYPMYEKAIKNANTDNWTSDRPVTGREDDGEMVFPESSRTETRINFSADADEYIRGYEYYYKKVIDMHRIYESWSGREDLIDDIGYEEYINSPAWIVEGQIIVKQELAVQKMTELNQKWEQARMMAKSGQGADPGPPPKVEEVTHMELIQNGFVTDVIVPTPRICMYAVMGDKLLYERVLPTEFYPIVFFMNLHTRTPYPMSDVRMVKSLQEYINKTRSLIIAHATTSTNTKILIPSGSMDMTEFEQKWAQPGVALEVDFDQGTPVPVQPTPLPNELYKNETDAKNDIDHQLGLYEMMMGNTQVAPSTYKATVSLDEFGQRKIKSKLADIEHGLKRVAEICIAMIQQFYKDEKIFRLLRPNNTVSDYMMNKRMVDDKGNPKILNDIGVGKYDVIVVTGSTLPTNRYAQLELYMDAYKNGIIDRNEVLKKTEVFDMEGVMQRTDMIDKLTGQLKQATTEIKKLKGDLQTREREVYHAKQKAELEKFKSDLDSTSTKAKAAGTVFEKRLGDAIGSVQKEVREASKDKTKSK